MISRYYGDIHAWHIDCINKNQKSKKIQSKKRKSMQTLMRPITDIKLMKEGEKQDGI
jgi:hypothetical protein